MSQSDDLCRHCGDWQPGCCSAQAAELTHLREALAELNAKLAPMVGAHALMRTICLRHGVELPEPSAADAAGPAEGVPLLQGFGGVVYFDAAGEMVRCPVCDSTRVETRPTAACFAASGHCFDCDNPCNVISARVGQGGE